jgi:hypothetical protein
MVRMKGDCRLSTGPPPQQQTLLVVKLEGGPAVSVKLGQKSCVIKSAYTLWARSLVKRHKGDEAAGLHIFFGVKPSEAP